MKRALVAAALICGIGIAHAQGFDTGGSFSTSVPQASSVAAAAVGIAQLSATGAAGATTFLRGDNTWAVPAGTGASLSSTQTWTGGNTYNSWTVLSGSATLTNASNTLGGNGAAITALAPANVSAGTFPNAYTFSGAVTHTANLILSSMSVVDAFNSSFGSVTAGSTSTLTWTSVTDRMTEFVTSSFTATIAGFYEISAEAGASQTGGQGCLLLKKNGTTVTGGNVCATGGAALATVIPVYFSRILNLAANDIVRIDGSATTANVTFQNMTLAIRRVP